MTPACPRRPAQRYSGKRDAPEPNVVKRFSGVLAAIGLAIAAAIVKGIFSMGLDALGWVGLAICIGIVVLVSVSALSNKLASDPNPPPPPPD
jgi:hypothetical protein